MSATVTATRGEPERTRFAWLNVVLAAWIVAGAMVAVRALNLGLAGDVAVSPYHLVGYAGLVALLVLGLALGVRARRRGVPLRRAFPGGFGTLGLGLIAAVGYVVLDIAWRETIGIADGIEGAFAPTRLLLIAALALIAVGPLRAAVLGLIGRGGRWPAVISGGLLLAALTSAGGIHPVVGQWMDEPVPAAGDDLELWSMRLDGGQQTRLVDEVDHVEANTPAVSPDGARVAYTRWTRTGGPDDWEADVWVANLDGSDAHAVAEGPDWQWLPHWSPDGRWIAYTVEPSDSRAAGATAAQPRPAPGPADPGFGVLAPPAPVGAANAELWRVAADGGTPERLTDGAGHDRALDWAPDGSRYAFDSDRDGDSEIWVDDPGGAAAVQVTDDPAWDWGPDWSPDGRSIVFTSNRTGNEDIWRVAADGSGLTQLTDDGAIDQGPAFSADGTRIVFVSDRTGETEIWSMAADGSDARDLTNSAGTVDGDWDAGDVTADGRIVFARSANRAAADHPLVREDLALFGLFVTAVLLSAVAMLIAGIGAPPGAFTVLFGVWTVLMATQWDAWRFVPAALVAGVVVDLVVRGQRPARRPLAAAIVAPGAYAVGIAASSAVTAGLAWSATLVLGAVLACMALGLGVALVATPRPAAGGLTTP